MAAKPGLSRNVSKTKVSIKRSVKASSRNRDKVKNISKTKATIRKKASSSRDVTRLDVASIPLLPTDVVKKLLEKSSFDNSGVDYPAISLDLSISENVDDHEDHFAERNDLHANLVKPKKVAKKDGGQLQTVFDLEEVDSPLIGTPKEVQIELDGLALRMQKDPEDQEAFERILTYIHKYLLGLVFKKYNFVKGYEESDIYQEALIALFKKAVPKFDPTRNMSFLNFAKMCINRHLITILHASKHRRKDQPINTAISLDHNPNSSGDDEDGCSLSNIIQDDKTSCAPYRDLAKKESYNRTLAVLKSKLSQFEIMVMEEYLQEKSYEEIAKAVTKRSGIKYNAKSVDNSLLRCRKKGLDILKESGGIENVPLLF